MNSAKGIKTFVILAFGVIFVYPLARFFLIALIPALSPVHSLLTPLPKHLLGAALNTLVLGGLAALISAPLGAGLAWFIENRSSWICNAYTSALWILFFIPSYVLTTGYQSLFSLPLLNGSVLEHLLYSRAGIVFMLTLKALPFSAFVARSTWANINTDLIDSVSVHRVRKKVRFTLLARLALPAIAAAFVIGFIESIQDFGIPATLGASSHLQLITYAIYEQISTTPLDFVNAARLSIFLLVMAAAAAMLHWGIQHKYRVMLISGRNKKGRKISSKKTESISLAAGLILLWSLAVIIPLAALVGSALQGFGLSQLGSLTHSVVFALVAATASTAIATVVARLIVSRRGFWIATLEGLSLVNMAVPGLILGAAYLMAFNNRYIPLYGTPLLLVIAYVAGTTPMVTRLMQSPIGQIDKSISDAAKVHGLGVMKRFFDIDAVLMAKPVTRGWSLSFGHILFELPISALLYPAGLTPLGVAIMNMNQEFEFGKASVLAVCGLAVALLIRGAMAIFTRGHSVSYEREARV